MKVKKLLSLVVIASIIVLSNNNIFAQNLWDESVQIAKSYNGQKGYGSSGILDCEEYLKHKHKGNVNLVSSKNIELIDIPQIEFSNGSMEGNCCITAITRLINYYLVNKEIQIADENVEEIYNRVREIAINKYNYIPKNGLKMMSIKPLIEDVFEYYNYKVEVNLNPITWNFKEHIKKEIDNNRPVILVNSMGFGYYRKHALAICGYEMYNINKIKLLSAENKEYSMIEVCDGWSYGTKFIDYNKFKHELQNLTSMIISVSIGGKI